MPMKYKKKPEQVAAVTAQRARKPAPIPDTVQLLIEIRGWMEGKLEMRYYKAGRDKELRKFVEKINGVIR